MLESSLRLELPEDHLFTALAEKHGHYCPMSTLGLRIGWAAQNRLEGQLQSISYQINTCAVDGVCLVLGRESLTLNEHGRHLLTFADTKRGWQIELSSQALHLAASYGQLETEYERESLLKKLRTGFEADLLRIRRIEGQS